MNASLRIVCSGTSYRTNAPPLNAPVRPELARELERVLECFARGAGFSPQERVLVTFGPGVVGHHQNGRAADIYEVAGVGLHRWFDQWLRHLGEASCADPITRQNLIRRACRQNLGWRLYKTLQTLGRWARPPGYPVQLFGPWTRLEGPLRAISDRLLRAHFDHIHIAK